MDKDKVNTCRPCKPIEPNGIEEASIFSKREPSRSRNRGVRLQPEKEVSRKKNNIKTKRVRIKLIDSDHEDLQELRQKELNGGVGYTRDLKVSFTSRVMRKWSDEPTKTKIPRRFDPIECKVYEHGTKKGKKSLEERVPKRKPKILSKLP